MVEPCHILERPGRGVTGQLTRAGCRELPHFREDGVDFTRQLHGRAVEVGLECCQPRLGTIESVLRRVRGRDAHLRQACRLRHQLFDGGLMKVSQGGPFLLDDAFEILKSLTGVVMEAAAGVTEIPEMGFELADRTRVAISGGVPASQDGGGVFSEGGEPLFDGPHVLHGRVTQIIDLRLQTREPLLDSDSVRLQVIFRGRMIANL